MRVRLIRKLAELADGVDLSRFQVGDVIDVPEHEARLLVAEQWAEPSQQPPILSCSDETDARQLTAWIQTIAAAALLTKTTQELHKHQEKLEGTSRTQQDRRRAEDLIREELRDSRAKTIQPK